MLIKEELSLEERKSQYDDYLAQHISGVQKSYEEIIRPWLLESTDDEEFGQWIKATDIAEMDLRIQNHDSSKYEEIEYTPYLDHFYPANGEYSDEESPEYKKAWLHHQHNNSHHWQHWLLLNDTSHVEDGSDKFEALEMDMPSVVEMLCDWSSFQYYRPGSTANAWYSEHGDEMVFNDRTREIVEKILERFPEL